MWRPFVDYVDSDIKEVVCSSDSDSEIDVGTESVVKEVKKGEHLSERAKQMVRDVFEGLANSGFDKKQLFIKTAYLTKLPISTVRKLVAEGATTEVGETENSNCTSNLSKTESFAMPKLIVYTCVFLN